MSETGRRRRLARVARAGAAVHLLALDHGLTMGWTVEQEPPLTVAEECTKLGISGIVCHFGLLPQIGGIADSEIFMQVHASSPGDSQKEVIVSPEVAMRADCVGIAVEFQTAGSSIGLAKTAKAVLEAREMGLLVLVMANYAGEKFSSTNIAAAAAQQLGPDYIKLRIPSSEPSDEELRQLRRIVSSGPMYLVAGGDSQTDLTRTLAIAYEVGMRGSCIGRHYFNSSGRLEAVRTVLSTLRPDG
jgi:DhnA family fructose-bisphosphate aldolase class Ia